MGEFAKFNGNEIKIGTCESMYYLRAEQAEMVTAIRGSVDPIGDAGAIRFRFPWPDEDGIEPGGFRDHARGLGLHGVKPPGLGSADHRNIQFSNPRGYLISLPCPEAEEGPGSDHGLTFGRNGFAGSVRIAEQGWRGGQLVTIAECGGCGTCYRIPSLIEATPYIEAVIELAKQAEHHERVRPYSKNDAPTKESIARAGDFFRKVAARIEAGYTSPDFVRMFGGGK